MANDRSAYFRARYLHKVNPNAKECPRAGTKLEAIFVCLECGAGRSYGVDGDTEYNPTIGCAKACRGRNHYGIPRSTQHGFVGVKSGDIWVRTLSTLWA